MTPGIRPLVAGNWKMNGLTDAMIELEAMRDAMKPGNLPKHDLLVCVPFT